ncbi:MAG: cell division protein ZipA [Gammaproteobacteria bacterium]|nr:MAG: cell division protein ZipA [Gammaproteobacteria bacterium]
MAELRWILLAAGLIVLLVIFLWGVRDKILAVFSSSQKEGKFSTDANAEKLGDQLDKEIESFAISKQEAKQDLEKKKAEPTFGDNSIDIEDKVVDFGEPVHMHEEDLQKSNIESDVAGRGMEPKITDIKEAEQKPKHEPAEYNQSQSDESDQHQVEEQQSEDGGVIVLYVRCPAGKLVSGKDLKRAFAKQGLVYGDMKIFHRLVKDIKGVRSPLFGIANMVEPGTFNLESMDEMETPGVTVFMQLPAVVDNLTAFNDMFKTSLEIAESINGELVTQNKNPVTKPWLEQMRTLLAAS